MNTHYVYIYYDPRTNQPFYVGKGSNGRAYDHLTEEFNKTDNFHKYAKIKNIQNDNLEPKIRLIYADDENQAYWLESHLNTHQLGAIYPNSWPFFYFSPK